MTITITYEVLLNDIMATSRMELAGASDPTARYLAEAGTEKLGKINRCITEGVEQANILGHEYFQNAYNAGAGNTIGTMPTQWDFVFEGGERRLAGKQTILASLLHALLRDLCLSVFYLSVSQPELAKSHSTLATSELSQIDTVLHTKVRPQPILHTKENS